MIHYNICEFNLITNEWELIKENGKAKVFDYTEMMRIKRYRPHRFKTMELPFYIHKNQPQ